MIQRNGASLLNTKTNKFTHYHYNAGDSSGLSTNQLRSLYPDRDGKIWIGTFMKGLTVLDPATGKRKSFLEYIPTIQRIYQDSNGTLWIVTDEGLYLKKLNDPDFSRFIDASGRTLTGYNSGIIEDENKNLYLNGINRVYRINLINFETVIIEVTQDEAELNNNEGSALFISGAFRDKNGKLYFGTGTGYFVLSPGDLNLNPVPPQIIISSLRVNGKSLYSDSNLTALAAQKDKEIFLTYEQNNIVIEFAGIHYGKPENNQHLYKLENYDQEWHIALKEKIATYSNLQPGEYIFRIKASNSDGLWAEKNLKIFISSPWWKTWWAYLLYFSVFVVAAILFDRIQRKRIIAKERERNRERELAQAKEIEKAYAALKNTQSQLIHAEKMASLGELTAGIAHEIQNPLNFVNNFSDVNKELLSEMKDELESGNIEMAKTIANDVISNEEKIKYHGVKADAIVKSMLQHSKTSSGQKELTDINALVDEYLKLAYHGMRSKDKNFNVNLETDYDPLLGAVAIIPQDIGRVLLNLYNNAFFAVTQKNQSAGNEYVPTVSVTTNRKAEMFEIKVKDNGSGIAENIQNKIFQPFFTTKPTGEGTGLGLSLSYDIVKAHGEN
jgi:signal transduction histidine kinase